MYHTAVIVYAEGKKEFLILQITNKILQLQFLHVYQVP